MDDEQQSMFKENIVKNNWYTPTNSQSRKYTYVTELTKLTYSDINNLKKNVRSILF